MNKRERSPSGDTDPAAPRRPYRLGRRAVLQEETRRRIVAAVVALHREIGPARTTISAIAERAGVERLTVYRHFPAERALFAACSAQFERDVPFPDPAEWDGIEDPAARLRAALRALYGYYRLGADMLTHITRDAEQAESVAELVTPWREAIGGLHHRLAEGWARDEPERDLLGAALRHALRFETWRSLAVHEGLDDGTAAELMASLAVASVSGGGIERAATGHADVDRAQ